VLQGHRDGLAVVFWIVATFIGVAFEQAHRIARAWATKVRRVVFLVDHLVADQAKRFGHFDIQALLLVKASGAAA
jgi:hypothetical protein